jgi:TPR repeat protein
MCATSRIYQYHGVIRPFYHLSPQPARSWEDSPGLIRRRNDLGHIKVSFIPNSYISGTRGFHNCSRDAGLLQRGMDLGELSLSSSLGICLTSGIGMGEGSAAGLRWLQKTSGEGDARTTYNLALCYQKGIGGARNMSTTVDFPESLRGAGIAKRVLNLGQCLVTDGARKDSIAGIKACERASDPGGGRAGFILGISYFDGLVVRRGLSLSIAYYKEARGPRRARAAHNLAGYYGRGIGVSKSEVMAFKAEMGIAPEITDVGSCFRDGDGIGRNTRIGFD